MGSAAAYSCGVDPDFGGDVLVPIQQDDPRSNALCQFVGGLCNIHCRASQVLCLDDLVAQPVEQGCDSQGGAQFLLEPCAFECPGRLDGEQLGKRFIVFREEHLVLFPKSEDCANVHAVPADRDG